MSYFTTELRYNFENIASISSRFEAIKEVAEQINKMFGLNIEVECRENTKIADDFLLQVGEDTEEVGDM